MMVNDLKMLSKIIVPDIPTALTFREAEELARLAEYKRVLEIGSLLGFSTIVLAQVASVVHSVDPHDGYPENDPRPTYTAFEANLRKYGVRNKVVVHADLAERVLPPFKGCYFDFAFVDAMGTYGVTRQCIWQAYLHTARLSAGA